MRLEKHGMKLEEEKKEGKRVVVSLSVHRSSGDTRPLER